MSALGCGFNRSTQHFVGKPLADGRDAKRNPPKRLDKALNFAFQQPI
jgi:hypothetical protein